MRRLFTLRRARRLPLYVTQTDRDGLRAAGRFNARVLDHLREHVQPGVATGELDRLASAGGSWKRATSRATRRPQPRG